MLNDRVATYSGLDKVITKKTKKRIERQKHLLEREEINPCKRTFEIINLEPGTSSCEDENIEEVTTIAQSRKHRRLVKYSIDIFVPHDILKKTLILFHAVSVTTSHQPNLVQLCIPL